MRIIKAAVLIASGAMLSWAPARADIVPAFKGNDTGGIIAYELAAAAPTPVSSRSNTARPMARW